MEPSLFGFIYSPKTILYLYRKRHYLTDFKPKPLDFGAKFFCCILFYLFSYFSVLGRDNNVRIINKTHTYTETIGNGRMHKHMYVYVCHSMSKQENKFETLKEKKKNKPKLKRELYNFYMF